MENKKQVKAGERMQDISFLQSKPYDWNKIRNIVLTDFVYNRNGISFRVAKATMEQLEEITHRWKKDEIFLS